MDPRTTSRRRCLARNALVATAGAALLASGGAGVAVAAPTAHTAVTARTPAKPPPSRYITLVAAPTTVRSGRAVTLSGRTRGFMAGTKVMLQQRVGTKWKTLRNTTTLTRNGTYRFGVKMYARGRQQLRTEVVRTVSRPVTVTVTAR